MLREMGAPSYSRYSVLRDDAIRAIAMVTTDRSSPAPLTWLLLLPAIGVLLCRLRLGPSVKFSMEEV